MLVAFERTISQISRIDYDCMCIDLSQESLCVCAQPVRDGVTMYRRLSLAGRKNKMIPAIRIAYILLGKNTKSCILSQNMNHLPYPPIFHNKTFFSIIVDVCFFNWEAINFGREKEATNIGFVHTWLLTPEENGHHFADDIFKYIFSK